MDTLMRMHIQHQPTSLSLSLSHTHTHTRTYVHIPYMHKHTYTRARTHTRTSSQPVADEDSKATADSLTVRFGLNYKAQLAAVTSMSCVYAHTLSLEAE